MTTLGNERGGNATTQHVQFQQPVLAASSTRLAALGQRDDPLVRQKLAWAYTQRRDHALRRAAHAVGGA